MSCELGGKEKCVGVRKVYNDVSFRLQESVRIGSEQTQHASPGSRQALAWELIQYQDPVKQDSE